MQAGPPGPVAQPCAAAAQAMSPQRRSLAFAFVAIAFVMDLLDVTIVNVALPGIGQALQADGAQIAWIVAGYALSFAVLLVVGGRLGDLYGHRKMFLWGVASVTLASLACGLATPAAGLVLICYPLHPPDKPERLRVDHFSAIDMPCLFVSGDRDPFGSPDEFAEHLPSIAGPVTTVWLPGKRHDLKGADEAIADAVEAWLARL